MRIAMFTNTYLPLVGGATLSIVRTADRLRAGGHEVVVVAPDYDKVPEGEKDVIRVPALKNFNQTRFSVPLSVTYNLDGRLDAFKPEIVHAHHPFLLGDSALRYAAKMNLPSWSPTTPTTSFTGSMCPTSRRGWATMCTSWPRAMPTSATP